MFKEILSVLRKSDLLQQSLKEASEMLSDTEIMFRAAMGMVMECKAPEIDIYQRDKEIDSMEIEVRKKVLMHLVVLNRKEDASAALVITSAVKDIERIGDYSKNIFELVDICPNDFVIGGEGAKILKDIENHILEIFSLTNDAYRDSDVEKAKLVMEKQMEISDHCDEIFDYLSQRPALGVEYAIIYALLSRYLKRISSHLKNIAVNIVEPFPNIDHD